MARIIRRIKRVIDWFPVIWKDYDWDYHSFYVIMRKKLSRMEPAIRDGYALNSEKTADDICFAIMLLDRLIACDYLENALIPHKRKWGELGEMITKETDDGMLEWLGNHWEKADTEEKRLLAEEEFRLAGRHSDWIEERDKNLLFEYISKHINRWWD
jgi:hypothetical protein